MLLALLVLSLLAGVVHATRNEMGDVFEGGKLSKFCRKHLESCDPVDMKKSLHALYNLEVVQKDLISWRTQWIGSVFVALAILVVAFSCEISVGKVIVLVISAFLASSCAFHHQQSWYAGHASKHTQEARSRCVQKLLGAPYPEYSYYGI